MVNLTQYKICEHLNGWTSVQKKFCVEHFDFMDLISKAAKTTLSECESQFKSRRWNCSTTNSPNIFNRLPESGLREASFVYALSSAALTYTITNACSEGKLTGCSCDESKKRHVTGGYQWSGCSDNIAYGMAIAENFLDPRVKNRLNLLMVNLHNFETGRKIIEKNMNKQCKCHGVSGSCEIKTCWRSMPTFSVIGAKLKEKYDAAVQVDVEKRINKQRIVPRNRALKKLSKSDLLYIKNSPDFCRPNPRLASYGTKDRICNKTSRGIDSCELLCCGRPFVTQLEVVTYKCNCTFKWCCSVTCKECKKIQEVTRCR